MKRVLSLVVSAVMVFSFALAGFAESAGETTHGELLYGLGIVSGSGDGEMILDEDQLLSRQEMVAILNRLSLEDDSSFIVPETPTFKDVPTTHWAYRDVELAVHKGLTSGIGNGLFGLNENINYNQASLFLIRALQYDTTGIDYKEAAKIIKAEYKFALQEATEGSATIERGDIFELLNACLNMTLKDQDTKMIDKLDFAADKKAAFNKGQATLVRYKDRLVKEEVKEEVKGDKIAYKLAHVPTMTKAEYNKIALEMDYMSWVTEEDFNGNTIYDRAVKNAEQMAIFMGKYFMGDFTAMSEADGMAVLEGKGPSFTAIEAGEATSQWAKDNGVLISASDNHNVLTNMDGKLGLHVESGEGIGGSAFVYEGFRQYPEQGGLTPYVILLKEEIYGDEEGKFADAYFAFTVNAKGDIVECAGSASYGTGYALVPVN